MKAESSSRSDSKGPAKSSSTLPNRPPKLPKSSRKRSRSPSKGVEQTSQSQNLVSNPSQDELNPEAASTAQQLNGRHTTAGGLEEAQGGRVRGGADRGSGVGAVPVAASALKEPRKEPRNRPGKDPAGAGRGAVGSAGVPMEGSWVQSVALAGRGRDAPVGGVKILSGVSGGAQDGVQGGFRGGVEAQPGRRLAEEAKGIKVRPLQSEQVLHRSGAAVLGCTKCRFKPRGCGRCRCSFWTLLLRCN